MGILKAKKEEQVSAPAFEAEEGAVVEVQAEVKAVTRESVAPEVAEQQAAEVAAEPAVEQEAPKSTAIIARAPGGQLKTLFSGTAAVSPLKDLENAFQKNEIDVSYDTFPRLRIDAGCIATADGKEAGDFVELQIISYSPTWTVTTGTDGDEGKKLVRFSSNGKTTNPAGESDEFAGTDLEEYRKHLVSLGFEKAAIKENLVVYGVALDAQEVDFAHLNEVVALQLAPQSRAKFNSYVINRSIQARMGRVQETSGHPVIRFTAERAKSNDGKSYFNICPSHGKTAPVDLG
jgi:hypothetical protein